MDGTFQLWSFEHNSQSLELKFHIFNKTNIKWAYIMETLTINQQNVKTKKDKL